MNKRILVIEDEVDLREAIVEVLQDDGFTVFAAENGQVGLSLALKEHPDLILLDLIMPVMDGHETFKHIRENSWGKNAKVLILTAMDDVNNIAFAHDHKPVDYFIKAHHSLADLLKKVKVIINTD